MKLTSIEDAKRRAVLKALQPIKNGWIIGLGSGTTMAYALAEIARLSRARAFRVIRCSDIASN